MGKNWLFGDLGGSLVGSVCWELMGIWQQFVKEGSGWNRPLHETEEMKEVPMELVGKLVTSG